MVLGNTIHLYNTTKEEFLQNTKWVKHELCHVQQFKEHGKFIFIIKYIWESMLHGYYDNKYEIEARKAEEDRRTKEIISTSFALHGAMCGLFPVFTLR